MSDRESELDRLEAEVIALEQSVETLTPDQMGDALIRAFELLAKVDDHLAASLRDELDDDAALAAWVGDGS